jgi:hypothetical protein
MNNTPLALIGTDGSTIIKIAPAAAPPTPEGQAVDFSAPVARGLKLLFDSVGIASLARGAASQTYVLEFGPAVAEQLSQGSAVLAHALDGAVRPLAKDVATGQIVGQGVLTPASHVNRALAAAAVWQIAAMVIAQKYLADIDTKLTRISEQLDLVHEKLDQQNRSRLQASLEKLGDYAAVLATGSFTELDTHSYDSQIEGIDRECLCIVHDLRASMLRASKAMREHKGGWAFDPARAAGELGTRLNEFESAVEPYLLALFVRTLGAQVKCSLPVAPHLAQLTLKRVRQALDLVTDEQEAFYAAAREAAINVEGGLPGWNKAGKHRTELMKRVDESLKRVTALADDLRRVVTCVEEGISDRAQAAAPPALTVGVGPGGTIVRVARVTAERG